jgi:1,4-dihydroxy-2-naphthoyl-CoA synthase
MDLLQAPETLLLEHHADGVLQVTLNRPDVGNAINTRMGQELLDLVATMPGGWGCSHYILAPLLEHQF